MTFTKEQIRKAMECNTADELLELAKSEGVELTREQAEEYIALMGKRELTEEELEQVAGGGIPGCNTFCKADWDWLTCPTVTCNKDKECPGYTEDHHEIIGRVKNGYIPQ